jgi:hypothetical protein
MVEKCSKTTGFAAKKEQYPLQTISFMALKTTRFSQGTPA